MSELAAAANNAKEGGRWVYWFLKFTYSDFWDTKHDQDKKWVSTKIIRFWVPDDMSEEDEEIRAMQIVQDIVGPSQKHLDGCDNCQWEDCDDYKHYFGVTKFHFVEKLPDTLPTVDAEQQAQEKQDEIERVCPQISQARADHKRQLKLAKFREALAEKEKHHRQEVEWLKKQFGVE
jgi:hypothetical protein